MTLDEYTSAVVALEQWKYPDAIRDVLGYSLADAADCLYRELARIAWQPWARPEAEALQSRCLSVRRAAWKAEYQL